ncbi:MAG: BON domain-containing protein [Pirellulaceae bacterium]|jgi:osmotically-inducible protein OsmY|nr:transport-associated protein [Planctomycetaceae bacterium]MDP6722269.1 BON domain-containing protein [Pirellulaceae bacterium]
MLSTDRPLDERIDTVIHSSPYLAGRRFRFKTEADGVTLEGRVGSYFQKQMAQEIVLRIDGVSRIDNRLQVG